jgi:hypothetical protein
VSHLDRTVLGPSTLVGKWCLDVNTNVDGNGLPVYAAPTWTAVNGVTEITPKHDPTVQGDRDTDSAGYGSSTVAGLEWGVDVKCARKVKADDIDAYDVGQEFLRALANKIGILNRADVRYYEVTASGPIAEAYRGYACVTYNPDGGAMDAISEVAITMAGQGARETITHPDYTAVVPTLASVTPAVGVQAGGTLHKLIGTGFMLAGVDNVVAATGVKLGGSGGTAATAWSVASDNGVSIVTVNIQIT